MTFRDSYNINSDLCFRGEYVEEVESVMNTPD